MEQIHHTAQRQPRPSHSNGLTIAVLGWVATAVFATSYFFRTASTLTKIQAAAACLWIVYGLKIGAVPVVVANLIVAGAALYSSFRNRPFRPQEEGSTGAQ